VVIATVVAGAVGLSAIFLLYRSIQIVPNGREQVVERFGATTGPSSRGCGCLCLWSPSSARPRAG